MVKTKKNTSPACVPFTLPQPEITESILEQNFGIRWKETAFSYIEGKPAKI
jgi:hypothetical protein